LRTNSHINPCIDIAAFAEGFRSILSHDQQLQARREVGFALSIFVFSLKKQHPNKGTAW